MSRYHRWMSASGQNLKDIHTQAWITCSENIGQDLQNLDPELEVRFGLDYAGVDYCAVVIGPDYELYMVYIEKGYFRMKHNRHIIGSYRNPNAAQIAEDIFEDYNGYVHN